VIPAFELEGAVATTELPLASNIFDYVRHWETTTPERVAIGDGERSWTWREWADRIRRAAAAQTSFGLLPGDLWGSRTRPPVLTCASMRLARTR
jgi:acyl-CoA synthetase (AMP-forming)/AMP-acid ligase II